MNIKERLEEYGLTESQYEQILKDCSDKIEGNNDYDWSEIVDKYGINIHRDSLRKAQQTIFGGAFVRAYFENKKVDNSATSLDDKISELRKERIKLQTANIERNRIDRNTVRQEMYYEQIGSACQTLPVPDFKPYSFSDEERAIKTNYCLTLSDCHYGATFVSENNEYSPEIFKERLEYLTTYVKDFITSKGVSKLWIAGLGDSLQGLIHLSDLKINDTSVVKAVVDYSRLIAEFLNELSVYADIEYVHVPSANHTQTRGLGTKASELADEDLEYVIGHYISDLLRNNQRVNVVLADEGKQYVKVDISGMNIYALHGHQIKNLNTANKDLSMLIGERIDCLLMGHYHASREIIAGEGVCSDMEVLISPSFIGSDPYSDSLFCGSKGAVKIYGFNEVYGHTETYKVVLN